MHNLWGAQCQATLICKTAGKSGCLCNMNLFRVSVSGFSLCIFLVSVGSTVYMTYGEMLEMVDNGKMVCIDVSKCSLYTFYNNPAPVNRSTAISLLY